MKKRTMVFLSIIVAAMLALTACAGGTSASATAANTVTVKSVTFAESLNANFQPVNPKTQFKPTDTIYVSVDVAGAPKIGTLNGKFYFNDQLISEATLDFATVNQGVIVSIGEDTFAGFNLAPSQPWPVGTGYHFDLYVNGSKLASYPYEVVQ
jgi:hypothetical protein